MRTLNRLLSLLLGLALAVAGVTVVIEVILAAAGESFVALPANRWLGWLTATSWSTASVMAILAAMTLVGLLLLLAELRLASRFVSHDSIPDWRLFPEFLCHGFQIGVDRSGIAEEEARQESKERIVDFSNFAYAQAAA